MTRHRTDGCLLEELTTPYYAFRDADAEVTLASIKGGAIPVDQRSVNADGENDGERYLKDEALKAEVANTPVFTSIDPAGYDALFLPGGHGTMFDYPGSDELARLVERFDREGKIVAAVCHGPAGLVSAKKADGTPLLAGRRVAASPTARNVRSDSTRPCRSSSNRASRNSAASTRAAPILPPSPCATAIW